MKVSELLNQQKTTFSFEFFPPQTPQASEELFKTISELAPLSPSFVSITYGAGGSTRSLTQSLSIRLRKETGLNVVSHLTCVGTKQSEAAELLEKYRQNDILNIMALRGDAHGKNIEVYPPEEGFAYAQNLVSFIRQNYPEFCIGVAGYPEGHPETPNRIKEMEYLKQKVDAGADYICTQLFFDNRDFFDFCERCEINGIRVPIIAGIMPITSRSTMQRMAELAAGARYPARLLKALSRVQDDHGFEQLGIHWATEQVLDLLDKNVRGIHFYTLNKSKATISIYKSLGLTKTSKE